MLLQEPNLDELSSLSRREETDKLSDAIQGYRLTIAEQDALPLQEYVPPPALQH
jgi:hypothetical protein